MLNRAIAPILVESSDSRSVLCDPANQTWLELLRTIHGSFFEVIACCYYLALSHMRSCLKRPAMPEVIELFANDRQQAQRMLYQQLREQSCENPFVGVGVDPQDETIPLPLRDPSVPPPSLRNLLDGPGAPPVDALCLMRAFLAAPLLGTTDSPKDVFLLLHSNPTFARACGFMSRNAHKQSGEFTTRRLPALSTCEQFNEVMTRYGLWYRARENQVRRNLERGVLEYEDTLAFDTTHVESNSHCDNLSPDDAQTQPQPQPQTQPQTQAKTKADEKVKHKKVERARKHCDCGKKDWSICPHSWTSTDQGAAVVVKGPSRVYWAHKASVVSFGASEIPIDVRVLSYGAHSDSKTLLPHLALLASSMPDVTEKLTLVVADSAYIHNASELTEKYPNLRLITPVRHFKCAQVADSFYGIDRFTPTGVPVCLAEHRFELRGRDIASERFIWVAPDDEQGQPVCSHCPMRHCCLTQGARRHIRVNRDLTPQVDWDHPQHFRTEKARYAKRTGVERAIKRIKVDLKAELLSLRDAHRVQAHFDRKLLTLHLLLETQSRPP